MRTEKKIQHSLKNEGSWIDVVNEPVCDWDELYEFEWRIMCPQEAKERDRRAHEALRKLSAINMVMNRMVDSIYCGMR